MNKYDIGKSSLSEYKKKILAERSKQKIKNPTEPTTRKTKKSQDIGKEIWFIEYYDHAFHIGSAKEAMNNPYKLWAVGLIHEENKDFILLRNCGTTSYEKVYSNDAYEMIVKKAIIKRHLLGAIGEEIELQ